MHIIPWAQMTLKGEKFQIDASLNTEYFPGYGQYNF